MHHDRAKVVFRGDVAFVHIVLKDESGGSQLDDPESCHFKVSTVLKYFRTSFPKPGKVLKESRCTLEHTMLVPDGL